MLDCNYHVYYVNYLNQLTPVVNGSILEDFILFLISWIFRFCKILWMNIGGHTFLFAESKPQVSQVAEAELDLHLLVA